MFEVDPENWEVILAFCAVQTQWSVSSGGSFIGLNYQSIEFVFKMYEVANAREVFEGLRVMEAEILRVRAAEKKA